MINCTWRTISRTLLLGFLSAILMNPGFAPAQAVTPASKLSVHWEELTAADFAKGFTAHRGLACFRSAFWKSMARTFLLGTDLLDVRYACAPCAEKEYALVFPEYYFGQISEAGMNREPSPIAARCNLRCSKKPRTRCRATAARK